MKMLEMTTISVVFKRRRRKRLNHVKLRGYPSYNIIEANRGEGSSSSFTARHTFIVDKNSRGKFTIDEEKEMRPSYKQLERGIQVTNDDDDDGNIKTRDNNNNNNNNNNQFSMLKDYLTKERGNNDVKSKRNFSETNEFLFGLLITCALLVLFATKVTCHKVNRDVTRTKLATYYYANLPKLAYISGARLKVVFDPQQSKHQSNTSQYVAAFLGIPYAAPPVGLLRLMPPGANNPTTSFNQVHHKEQHLLLPSGQRHSVRDHSEFGHECVRLSDWLEPLAAKGSISLSRLSNKSIDRVEGVTESETETTNSSISKRGSRSSGGAERGAGRGARDSGNEKEAPQMDIDEIGQRQRKSQSEDCLNLNVFIPINESNNKNKQTTNNHHEQKHQIKLNYPSQYFANYSNSNVGASNNREQVATNNVVSSSPTNYNNTTSQDDLDNKEKSGDQALWSVESDLNESEKKLPVLVLFHGTRQGGKSRPNTLNYLSTTHLLNSIVITFNYRIGLLGFLPYIDEEASSLDGLKAIPRNNHAIWDQLGLLHWLKHNVANFHGDPNNIALLPLDNEAAQLVQLLTLSPLAKGLFNRVFLIHDDMRVTNERRLNLNKMLSSLDETRDLRRKLVATLSSIVKQLTNKQQTNSGRVFDYIQSASLPELAQLDRQLNQLGSEQLVALANEPTLYDRVLFPQLSLFVKGTTNNQLETNIQQNLLNQTILQSEVNYCLYIRQLATTTSDPLNLISNFNNKSLAYSNQAISVKEQKSSGSSQQLAETKVGAPAWHRDTNSNGTIITTKANNFIKRTQAAIYFNHMQQSTLLSRYLNNFGRKRSEEFIFDSVNSDNIFYEDGLNKPKLHEYDEDQQQEVKFEEKPRKRSNNDDSSPAIGRNSLGDYIANNLNHFMPLMPSFDLMIGFIKTSSDNYQDLRRYQFKSTKDFQNIVKILVNTPTYLDEQLLFWLKFSDHHFVANSAINRTNLAQLCNLDNVPAKPIPFMRTSHVFIIDSDSTGQPKQNRENWLLDATDDPQMLVGLANFVEHGNANGRNNKSISNYWPIYNTLERKIKRFFSNGTMKTPKSANLTKQIRIQLDILPYLSLLETYSNISKNTTTDLQELLSCLNDIDTAISESSSIQSNAYGDNSITTGFQDHLKCLSSSSSRFKNRIRQYGSDDLEPLIRHIKLQKNRYLDNGHNGASSSSITTRNLVDEGPILNNLEQSDAGSQLELELASSNGSSLIAYVSSNNLQDQTNTNSGLKRTSMGIKGFLANAYKDPIGKALTLVVGTGLLIFLLNLIIVAIITFRSSRRQQRSIGQQDGNDRHFSCSQNHQQPTDVEVDNFVQSFEVNSKKSTLKKGSRRFEIEGDKSQSMNSSFKGNQQGNSCLATHSSRGTKQLKFNLTGMAIEKGFKEEEEEDCEFNNQYNLNENINYQSADTMQMVEFRGHQDGNNNGHSECHPVKDKHIMLETMSSDFNETGILLSISPMLTKYNSSCINEHLLINDEHQQQQENTERNEFYHQQYAEQRNGSFYYHNDEGNHLHLHHQCNNSNNSPITSTQSSSTMTTVCPTNTTNSFNNSSIDQKIRRDLSSCCSTGQSNHVNNKLSCFHQNQNHHYHHHHHHVQNQSSASPGSSATLSVTPIPIQLESFTLTQTGGLNHNFHLDSIYQIENQANFVTFSDQTDQNHNN